MGENAITTRDENTDRQIEKPNNAIIQVGILLTN